MKTWAVWGDHPGDDVETYTGVAVQLNPVKIDVLTEPSNQETSEAITEQSSLKKIQVESFATDPR